jgi:hypothetical protein
MHEELKPFISSFELSGYRLPNGKITTDFPMSRVGWKVEPELDDWPEEIKLFLYTYWLEEVRKGDNGHESAIYM